MPWQSWPELSDIPPTAETIPRVPPAEPSNAVIIGRSHVVRCSASQYGRPGSWRLVRRAEAAFAGMGSSALPWSGLRDGMDGSAGGTGVGGRCDLSAAYKRSMLYIVANASARLLSLQDLSHPDPGLRSRLVLAMERSGYRRRELDRDRGAARTRAKGPRATNTGYWVHPAPPPWCRMLSSRDILHRRRGDCAPTDARRSNIDSSRAEAQRHRNLFQQVFPPSSNQGRLELWG